MLLFSRSCWIVVCSSASQRRIRTESLRELMMIFGAFIYPWRPNLR
ncbi:Protein of unknown function [Pyronema omphalodes CBS 100304]|uniref:Uncharacterized protein n=1 Tax=Pyronema omphalodes (strain CBS 100304) TaxID=1076935 RepID=U4L380_PYROM|nr:Protein of unknown function [Pyronema omphalodes CBS 100304]